MAREDRGGQHAVARRFREAIPDAIEAYASALRQLRSPLALKADAWAQCERQARAILGECADALTGGGPAEPSEAAEFTRLLGEHRALQQIPVAESIRAVEVLWQACQVCVRAAERAAPSQQAWIHQTVNASYRSASGIRLYHGALGHEAVQGHAEQQRGQEGEAAPAPSTPPPSAMLTQREREILVRVDRALTNRQIASDLGISEATVKRHLYNACQKLDANSRIDAVRKARSRDLLSRE